MHIQFMQLMHLDNKIKAGFKRGLAFVLFFLSSLHNIHYRKQDKIKKSAPASPHANFKLLYIVIVIT